MKYTCFVPAMLFLWVNTAQAQKIRPLSVGDTVPDITLNHIINAPYSSCKLSDFEGKVIILDFFATGCGSCVKALPVLDSLQQQLKNNIQIMVVCYEPAKTINSFLRRNEIAKKSKLPFITGDTTLKAIFQHYLLPHEVWLKDNKVKAITLAEAVTASNIQRVLTDQSLNIPVKKDLLGFNPSLSLYSQMKEKDTPLFVQQSLFTNYYDGVGSRRGTSRNGSTKRIYFINWNILNLFQFAWGFEANRIVLEVKDTALLLDRRTDPAAWRKHNLYCYEVTVQDSLPDSAVRNLLKTTLTASLQVQGDMEKRRINCYVLTYASTNDKLKASNQQTLLQTNKARDSLTFLHHTLDAFTASCNAASYPSPGKPIIINETGITYPVDIQVPTEALNNILVLQKALLPYGLRLLTEQRDLTVFVLRDKPSTLYK